MVKTTLTSFRLLDIEGIFFFLNPVRVCMYQCIVWLMCYLQVFEFTRQLKMRIWRGFEWPFHTELFALGAGGECRTASFMPQPLVSCQSECLPSFKSSASPRFSVMGISHDGWAHKPIQGWWALNLRRQLGENSEVEYSCHWARPGNHLKCSEWCCRAVMVTITKLRRHGSEIRSASPYN